MIKSQSENDAVNSFSDGDLTGYCWLGARRESNRYFWLDGTEVIGFNSWWREPKYDKDGIRMLNGGKWVEENHILKWPKTVCERSSELGRLKLSMKEMQVELEKKIESQSTNAIKLINENKRIQNNQQIFTNKLNVLTKIVEDLQARLKKIQLALLSGSTNSI